jgi:hypothetical protein
VEFDPLLLIPLHTGQHQPLCVAVGEERGQSDAVVRGTGFFAERNDAEFAAGVVLDQLFAKAVADHAVADDDDRLRRVGGHGQNHGFGFRRRQTRAQSSDQPECNQRTSPATLLRGVAQSFG